VIETGLLSLLQKEDKYGPLTSKQHKVLERVLRNTKVTKLLVNDALEVGRSREGIMNKTTFPIHKLITQSLVEIFDLNDYETAEALEKNEDLLLIEKMLFEKGIDLAIDEQLWSMEIYLDEGKVNQILRNLLSNALKYRKARIDIHFKLENDLLSFSISDDGEGIPESYHQKIFESYFQMKGDIDYCVRGHGLGLAGVLILVEEMGGQLSLESDKGKGAKFMVRLPLSKER
jgi:signal transduction histidine kinase